MSIKDDVIEWWADHAVEREDGTWVLMDDDDIAFTDACATEEELTDKYYQTAIDMVHDNLADYADMHNKLLREG